VKGGSTTLKEAKEVKELGESKPSDEKQHNHEQGQDGDVCKMKRGNIVCKDKKDEQTIDANEENGIPERRGVRRRPRGIQAA